jgi:outer membrane protein assembly factor BamB
MSHRTILGMAAAFLLPLCAGAAEPAHWPGWRGDGSGISRDRILPLYWSAEAGIAWRTALPGEGHSSPVVWGDRIFLTAATDAGTNRLVLCLDRNDGKILWRRDLPAERVSKTAAKNGFASATPVTDGERVYAFFDSPGLTALDRDGKTVWTRDLGPFKNDDNMASSPVLCGELLVQCCDQDAGSFIVALDRKTGEERWRAPRAEMSRQWATPLVVSVDEKPQIVVNGQTVIAYDPADGREIWRCRGMRPNVTPSPVAEGGLVYAASGRNGPALAIDPRGTGDVTESRVRMQVASGGPYVPSPLAFSAGLLLPGDDGRLRLIGADGKTLSELRVAGHYTASPVAAQNLVYWPDEKGHVAVVRLAGDAQAPQLERVTVNDVGGACLASPAVAGGKLLIRTDQALLCIAGAPQAAAIETADLPGTLAELKALYADHPATDGADAALRIAIVEKVGTLKDPECIPFLRDAALKDRQWDVGETAAKRLGDFGAPAIPALIALMGAVDWQPYLKTTAADALGNLAAADAVPSLLKAADDRNVLVRVPSLQALGKIAAAHPAGAGTIVPALTARLKDGDGAARKAAVEALARCSGVVAPGPERDALIGKLAEAAQDRNPLVAQAAEAALKAADGAARAPAAER